MRKSDYLTELEALFPPERVTTNPNILEHHGKDESYHEASLPDVVVYPITKEEVSTLMKIATKHKTPIIAFGLGSSLEGHVIPYEGGISVDFTLMKKVVEILPDDFLVKVQPGVTRTELNDELKKHGLFFPC